MLELVHCPQQLTSRGEAKVTTHSLAMSFPTGHFRPSEVRQPLMQEGEPGLATELQSSDGSQSLSDAPPAPKSMPQGEWTKQHVTLTASADSYQARLAVTAAPGTSILLDQVSLWPSKNGPEGSISPFRPDLIQMVMDLNPRCGSCPSVLYNAGGCWLCSLETRELTMFWWFAGLCASPEAASVRSLLPVAAQESIATSRGPRNLPTGGSILPFGT